MRSEITIYKSSIDKNLKAIKKRLQPGVKTMAVVKDNAYGHGLIEFAKLVQDQVDWFCVAHAERGVELRKAGFEHPILVFEIPSEKITELYTQYNLVATVADISTFDKLRPGTRYHLNFDTGMHRLGLLEEQVPLVKEKIKQHNNLHCEGIYTHFANPDDDIDVKVETQLERFTRIRAHFPQNLLTHTANTGAIFYHTDKDLQFDAVRAGIGLYGYAPGRQEVPDLESILEWTTHIVQIKKINKDEPVSYGSIWNAPADGFIYTIPVGYGDGIPRILSGKLKVMINNKLYNQVGRVTMDYIMVYSTDEIDIDSKVYLFNRKELNPEIWANEIATIPYEITTGLNARVKIKYE